MRLKTLILVTTALLSIPVVADCRPSSSYSSSSSRSIGGGSRSYGTTSRSVSSYGSSGYSARSSMNSTGSSVSSGWFSRKSSSNSSEPRSSTPVASSPNYGNSKNNSSSIPVYHNSAPTTASNNNSNNSSYSRGSSASDNFISSMAGSYIGSRLANADSRTSSPASPPPAYNESSPTVSYRDNSEPSHNSHILMWFFILLLAGGGAAAIIAYKYNKDNSDDSDDTDNSVSQDQKDPYFPGMNVTINPNLLLSDTGSSFCQLHFEADATGRVPVVGVSHVGNIWHLYLDNQMNEFVRLFVVNGEIKEARFFSYINQYPIGSDSDMENWLGNSGLIGESVFSTEDGISWNRETFENNDSRIEPDDDVEIIKTISGKNTWRTISCMYYRMTGFDKAFCQSEFLYVSYLKGIEDGNAVAYVKTWAGLDIPVASLDLA